MLLRPRIEVRSWIHFLRRRRSCSCAITWARWPAARESPDAILRRAYDRLRSEAGVDLWALGEVEYFLGKHAAESDIYGADERGYHASSPFVFGQTLRRQALVTLAEIGVRSSTAIAKWATSRPPIRMT